MRKGLWGVVLLVGIIAAGMLLHSTTHDGEGKSSIAVPKVQVTEIGLARKVELTIVYDNDAYDPRLKTAWGARGIWTRAWGQSSA
jgi:hypothetical protein